VAPWFNTVVATRLMRVTGDCLEDARVAVRFADFFVAPRRLGFALAALFVTRFARVEARFDAAADFRRALLPDDFDAVAMIDSSGGRYEVSMRKIRAHL
jgi:hypothetical protein